MKDKWFSQLPFVTIYQAKDIGNDDLALIDRANLYHYIYDYRAIRRPVTHKRHRRNREITVRRGSLAVSSILGTVEFRYRIRHETSREANRTRNDRLRGTGITKHGYAQCTRVQTSVPSTEKLARYKLWHLGRSRRDGNGEIAKCRARAAREVTHLSPNKIFPPLRWHFLRLDSTCDAWLYKFHGEKFPVLLRSFQIRMLNCLTWYTNEVIMK